VWERSSGGEKWGGSSNCPVSIAKKKKRRIKKTSRGLGIRGQCTSSNILTKHRHQGDAQRQKERGGRGGDWTPVVDAYQGISSRRSPAGRGSGEKVKEGKGKVRSWNLLGSGGRLIDGISEPVVETRGGTFGQKGNAPGGYILWKGASGEVSDERKLSGYWGQKV